MYVIVGNIEHLPIKIIDFNQMFVNYLNTDALFWAINHPNSVIAVVASFVKEYSHVAFRGLPHSEWLSRNTSGVLVGKFHGNYFANPKSLKRQFPKAQIINLDTGGELSVELGESLPTEYSDQEIFLKTLYNYVKGEENMDSIEASIAKAMAELGIAPDGSYTPQTFEPAPLEEPKEKPATPPKQQKPSPKPSKPKAESIPEPKPEPEDNDETAAIYCKIKDGSMALLIPTGFPLEQKELGGDTFNVITVNLPDLNSAKLQELEVYKDTTENPAKPITPKSEEPKPPKPPMSPKAKPERVPASVPTGSIEELTREKLYLDKCIREARAENDTLTVTDLRKKRRAVRSQINKLAGG